MADRTVRVILQGDATALVNAARQAQAALRDLSNTNVGRLGDGMRQAASGAREAQSAFDKMKATILGQVSLGNLAAQGIISAFRGIKDAIGDTIKAGADYQTTLNIMGAVSGATADQMVQVSAKARDLGKDITIPGTSATDAAKAMTELAKGGMSVAQAMTSAKGTLQLAAAAQIDAAKAAEIQVNAMAAFHIGADQAAHVADVLANVSNAASGEITDFAAGLTAAGATAHSFGISLEDTNTVLGLFANAGIKGEEGGTLFKTMLTKLAAPSAPAAAAMKELGLTVYDASGKFVGMAAVTDQLRAAHDRLTTAAYNTDTAIVFGTRGIKGAAILGAEAGDAFGNMSDAINKTGTAEQVAAAKMEGFNGALENLKNQWQDIQLTIFDKVGPGLTDLITNAAGALPQIADAAMGAIGYVGSKVEQFLGPLIDGAKGLAEKVAPYVMDFAESVKNGITTALDAVAPFGEKLSELFSQAQNSGVMTVLGTALVGVGKAFEGVMTVIGPILAAAGGIIDFFNGLPGPIQTVVYAFGAMLLLKGPLIALFDTIRLNMGTAIMLAQQGVTNMGGALGTLRAGMAATGTAAKGMWAAMGGWVGIGITALITGFSLFAGSMNDTSKAADNAKESIQGYISALQQSNGVVNESVRSAAVAAITTAQWGDNQKDLTGFSKTLGLTLTDLTDAMTGVAGKSDQVEAAYNSQKDALQGIIDKGQIKGSQGQVIFTAEAQNAITSLSLLNQQHTAWQALADQASSAGSTAQEKNDAIAGSASGAASATSDLAVNQDAVNAAMKAGADPTTAMKDALKDMKDAADEADTAGQFLWATLEQIHGGNIDAEQSARLEAAAFRDIGASARDLADAQATVVEKQKALNDAVNQYGADSPQAAQASRDLAAANDAVSAATDKQADANVKAAQTGLDAAGKAYVQKAAMGDLAGATEDARAKTQEARDQFIKAQTDLGMTADQAAALADHYHLIPDEVVTNLQANGIDKAQQQADALTATLSALDGKFFRYTVQQDGTIAQTTLQGTVVVGAHDHADGGWVTGPGGPRDDQVHARLSPGEFVVNAAQAKRYPSLLVAINDGTMGFADGGLVPGGGGTTATAGAAVAVTAPDPAVFAAAWKAIGDAAKNTWEQVILPVMDALSQRNTQAGVDFTAMASLVQSEQQGTIQPTYDAINAGSQGVGVWQQWLRDVWAQAWQSNQDATSNTWNTLGGVLFPSITAGLNNLGVAQQNLAATTGAAWSQIGGSIQGTYDGQIVPAWTGVQGFANEVGSFFSGIATGIGSATDTAKADIQQITDAINGFFALVDGKTPQAADGGAVSTLLGVQAKADGGVITAGTGPRSDDVLVRVSKGEYVVNAAATAKHRGTLDQINYGFADGGHVGDTIAGNLTNVIVSGVERAIGAGVDKALAKFSGGFSTAAGFNPSQDPSSFGWVRAGNIQPFSWGGLSTSVAGGTQGLWNSLLTALAPTIPGGIVDIGGFENRDNVNSPGVPSFHAYGLAMDVNAGSNPNGVDPASIQGRQYVIPIGPAESLAAKLGMLWGGDFQGTKDPMHFEIHVSPSAITGIGAPTTAASGGDWLSQTLAKIKNAQAFNPAYSSTGGVEQWRATVDQALTMIGQPTSLDNIVLNQIRTESSGDPNSINLTDSNATVLHDPSIGLVQVIGSTFRNTLAAHGFSNLIPLGQRNPTANLVAGMLYAIDRYGSIAQGMRGVAYAGGGLVPGYAPGQDSVPAWLSPGEAVISRMTGYKNKNKALLDTAASWFGGSVVYPDNMPPVGFGGSGHVEIHNHTHNHVHTGNEGVNVENLTALSPGQATAELDYALARCR